MARIAGQRLHRYGGWQREPFTAASWHVRV